MAVLQFLRMAFFFFVFLASCLLNELCAVKDQLGNDIDIRTGVKRKAPETKSSRKKSKITPLEGQQDIRNYFQRPVEVPGRSAPPTRSIVPLPVQSRPAIIQPSLSIPPPLTRALQGNTTPLSIPVQRPTRIHSAPQQSDYKIEFIRGRSAHIEEIISQVEEAESEILIGCWKLKFIPLSLLSALRRAQRNGVSITFFVKEVINETVASYFQDEEEFEDGGDAFTLIQTETHAKFLIVDKTTAIFGSFNALDSNEEEDDDEEDSNSSVMISGSIKQMWPFLIRLYFASLLSGHKSNKYNCLETSS